MTALDRLRGIVAEHATEGMHATVLPRVSLVAFSQTTELTGDMAEPGMALVVHGVKRTVLGDREFTYGAGQYLVASVDLPVTGAIIEASSDRPFLVFLLHLDPAAIATLLVQSTPAPVAASPACGIAVSDASPAMLDAATRLLGLIEHPQDAAVLAPVYERELLWRLLTGAQGAMVRQIGLADSRLAHLGQAIGWIRAHYNQPLRIDHLASLCAMSTRGFHRHFRDVTRMTPLQYQKHLRLHEARARLAAGPSNIASVGYAVGYDSPSQFSREYHRMYGVPPGHTQPAPEPRRRPAEQALLSHPTVSGGRTG
jgi:AraC-like DNA-binding protein